MSSVFSSVKLKDVAKIYSGNSINEKVKKEKYTGLDSGVSYISTKDISFSSVINYDNGVLIPTEEVNNFKIAPPNTVFICAEGGSAGRKVSISDRELCFVNKLFAIVAGNNAIPKYIYYAIRSHDFIKQFKKSMAGIIGGVSLNKFKELEIMLPPLNIQKKIVSKLDAIFAEIDKATAAAEANAKNAEALFQSYLRNAFESENLVKLLTITNEITDGDHQPPPKAVNGVPFITISNVNKNTREIDFSNTFKVSQEYFNALKKNRKPVLGDVLYTVTGSFGIPVHVNFESEFCFQRHIGLIRPSDNTDSKWLFWLMLSPQVFQQANDSATGAAQLTVSLKAIRNFNVPSMPLSEQKKIVKVLDTCFSHVRKLQNSYKNKVQEMIFLKHSILKQAFNGELVKG